MNKKPAHKYIFLVGGLSAGPIVPLLAVAEEWRTGDSQIKPVVLDVRNSVGQHLAKTNGYKFERIITGKLRRYFSFRTLGLPFLLICGLIQALLILRKYRPIAVLGAGGFVQVPVVVAAWLMKVPSFIHQQDVQATLTNTLTAPLANLVTVTFESSIRDFPQGTGLGKKYVSTNKIIWTGNPRQNSAIKGKPTKTQALKHFGLHNQLPVLLVIGGGTGAKGLNTLIYGNLGSLTKVVQVLHGTGQGKRVISQQANYHPFEYIEDMDEAYTAADVVVSRAGLGAMTGLAEHSKPAIIIPIPHSHQERNAELLFREKAAIILDQTETTPEKLQGVIRELLFDPKFAEQLGQNLHRLFPLHAAHKVYKVISDYLTEHAHA